MRRLLTKQNQVQVTVDDSTRELPLEEWWSILEQSGAYLSPHDGNETITFLTQAWIVKYAAFSMQQLWLDFRDNYLCHSAFEEHKQKWMRMNQDEYLARVRHEQHQQQCSELCDEITALDEAATQFLDRQKTYNKLSAVKQRREKAAAIGRVEAASEQSRATTAAIQQARANINEVKKNYEVGKAEMEANDLIASEIEAFIDGWQYLTFNELELVRETDDNQLLTFEAACKELESLNRQLIVTENELVKAEEQSASVVSKIDRFKSSVLVVNLLREDRSLAVEYLTEMQGIATLQDKNVSQMVSANDEVVRQLDSLKDEALQTMNGRLQQLKDWEARVQELAQKLLERVLELREFQRSSLTMQQEILVEEAFSLEIMINLQLSPDVTRGLIELELLLYRCSKRRSKTRVHFSLLF